MNEKEFLLTAIQFLIETKGSLQYGMEALDLDRVIESVSRDLDEFIKYHHQSYLPVFFLKLNSSVELARNRTQAQAKLKMADFFQFAGLEFTEEVAAKLEAYWDKV